MTAPAAELRAAADKLRDLATRTNTTLERHEVQWTDLTVSDTAAKAKARPMVWSQYAAAVNPALGLALADWLGCLAMLDPSERDAETCGWCSANHPAAVARAINAT